jgi:hypothetical protein
MTSLLANSHLSTNMKGTVRSDGNKLGSGQLTNSGSTSGKCKALFPSPRRLELFCRPHSLLFGWYQEFLTRQYSRRVVKITTNLDLTSRLKMRRDIHTFRILLRHVFR